MNLNAAKGLGLRPEVARLSPRSNPSRYASCIDPDWQLPDAADEVGVQPPRRSHHLDVEVAGEDFFPEYLQLQIRQSIADTAVNTCAVGEVLARLGPIDDEMVRPVDHTLVAVAGNVPHDDLVAAANVLAGKLGIARRRAAHVYDGRLIADGLGNEARDQLASRPHQLELCRVLA